MARWFSFQGTGYIFAHEKAGYRGGSTEELVLDRYDAHIGAAYGG